MQLGNSPRSQTMLRLEARKSFALGLRFLNRVDKTAIDLTSCTVRLVVAQPKYKGGAAVITKTATILDALAGEAQFALQALDLDLAEGEYPFTVTLVSALGYSTVVLKGAVDVAENTDTDTSASYAGVNPATNLAVYLEDGALVEVQVESLNGMAIDYTNADGVVSSWIDQAGSASRGSVLNAAVAFDGDPASALRVQQDARLGGLYVKRTDALVSAKYYGAVGDGVADDTSALQSWLNYLAANGATGYLPSGTYRITAGLTVTDAALPFRVIGAGEFASVIKRDAAFGSVLSLTRSHGWTVEGLKVDGGLTAFPTGANHGIVALDCSRATLHKIRVENWLNSAILAYSSDQVNSRAFGFTISECTVYGNGASTNNGILLSSMDRSRIVGCRAQNVQGNPGIGLQLKNNCVESKIIDGYASTCDDGFSFGSDTAGYGPKRCTSSDLIAYNCNAGVTIGESYNCEYAGVVVDMANAGNVGVDVQTAARNSAVHGLQVLGVPTTKPPVRIDGQGCRVEIDLTDQNGTNAPVQFTANAVDNHAALRRAVQNGTALVDGYTLVDHTTTLGNSFDFANRPFTARHTIATDAITVRNPLTRVVLLESEAAAATDNLSAINGGVDGQEITLRTRLDTQDITVAQISQTGGIVLAGGVSMVLNNTRDTLRLVYASNVQRWLEIARADNGA